MKLLGKVSPYLFAWTIGGLIAVGIDWARLTMLELNWGIYDFVLVMALWPLALGIDLVRIAEYLAQ